MWKKVVKDYFSFTRKERVAIILLVFVILFVFLLPFMLPEREEPIDQVAWEQFRQQVDQLKTEQSYFIDSVRKPGKLFKAPYYDDYSNDSLLTSGKLFYFDPNSLSPEGWKKLGLPERTIQTIQHFLSKGGRFKHEEDIGKIYGLRKAEVKRLLPYVRIARVPANNPSIKAAKDIQPDQYTPFAIRPAKPLDINTADTGAFIALRGIGSKLAARIVLFREKLGGFHSIEQVAEVYGLPDSTFQKIRSGLAISAAIPDLNIMNINTVDVERLKQHPYFRWNIANAIVLFRRQHGPFKRIEDLQQIDIIPPDVFKKLAPYVKVD